MPRVTSDRGWHFFFVLSLSLGGWPSAREQVPEGGPARLPEGARLLSREPQTWLGTRERCRHMSSAPVSRLSERPSSVTSARARFAIPFKTFLL